MQSVVVGSSTVTVTLVPPLALSTVFFVLDSFTMTFRKSTGSTDTFSAACAAPLLPIQNPSSNSPSQRFDMLVLTPRAHCQEPGPAATRSESYNARPDGESNRASPVRLATLHRVG